MAQILVRQLDEVVKEALRRRALRHGRSMEEEIRHILRDVVKAENTRKPRLGSRIAARFKKAGLTSGLPELRGEPVRSADFGK